MLQGPGTLDQIIIYNAKTWKQNNNNLNPTIMEELQYFLKKYCVCFLQTIDTHFLKDFSLNKSMLHSICCLPYLQESFLNI